MQCKDVEAVVGQEGLVPLPKLISTHLAECSECRNYIADLTTIVDVARKMPSEITPPDRIWISIRAQLELEGIIREPAPVPVSEHAPWWQGACSETGTGAGSLIIPSNSSWARIEIQIRSGGVISEGILRATSTMVVKSAM